MRENPLKKNSRFYLGMVLNVAEGMLSGFNFLLLYEAMKMLWNGTINSPSLLRLSLFLGGVFILRIVIYSIGYTQSQIGGAAVSNRTRLFLGDKIKRIPLSRFTQGQTGQYINIVTSDVNNYEKILTHTVGDILKHITFCTMMVIFVGCIWLPGGIILACVELVLIPFLWLSFRVVRKYGTEKNAVSAETVSSIVEYATGIQTFRAYGIGGTKNETVTSTLQHFSDVSYNYEKHGIPTNAIQCIFLWIGLPVMIWAASIPMLSGKLDPISYLLICMLPMLLAKLSDSISRGLMSYKNLKISKDKVVDIIEEPEETGSMEPLHTATHEITFDNVDFSYVPGEPVLKHATFTVPDQKLTAIVGDSGSGKSTILKSITRQLSLIGGTVYLEQEPMSRMTNKEVSRKLAVVLTERMRPELMTCEDVVSTGRYPYTGTLGILSAEDKEKVKNAMEMVHAWDLKDRDFTAISDGQRQRILLARAICQEPEIIILDEPTSFLDIRHKLELLAILKKMVLEKQMTVIMSLHELDLAQKISDQVICVHGDHIEKYGAPEEIFTSDYIRKLYGITRGSYNAEFGCVEMEPPAGEPRVFVIGGNGSGIPVYRKLQRQGIPFATGVLHTNDADYQVAKELAARVITEKPFECISQESFQGALEIMEKCREVYCPLKDFGTMNKKNLELFKKAEKSGKLKQI